MSIDQMDVVTYLRTLSWPKLQVLFGIGFDRSNVDHTIEMSIQQCSKATSLLQTRCLFSTNLCAYLLNNRDAWEGTDIASINDLSKIRAINIEIDVTTRIDHMFILAYLGKSIESPTGWYIIQSYVNLYHTRIEPIDAMKLIKVIQRWRLYGVNPKEWKMYFHADMDSTNPAIPYVYATNNVYLSSIPTNVRSIYNRINSLLKIDDSYVYDYQYMCILNNYIE